MTVTVGFAPAATPGLVIGGTSAAQQEAAPEGLFAALLARLDANAAASGDNITASDFGALIKTLVTDATSQAEEPEQSPAGEAAPSPVGEPLAGRDNQAAIAASPEGATVDNQLDKLQSTEGKALLKDLGNALIALNDTLEAGQPVDPALEKKLDEALDAVAVYLGVLTPPPVAVDPRITALASGEGVLPAAPAAAAPVPTTPDAVAPPVPAPATIAPAASSPDAAADPVLPAIPSLPADLPTPSDTAVAKPVKAAPEALPDAPAVAPRLATAPSQPANADPVQSSPAPSQSEATSQPEAAKQPEATKLEDAPAALRQLGLYIGKLADKLATQDPELAKKLSAVADGLKSGTAANDVAAALGLDDTSAEPEVERIIAALSATRPTAKPTEARPFIAPSLALPDTVAPPAGKASEPPAAAAPVADPVPKLETTSPKLATTEPETVRATRVEKPEPTDAKPAPAPATTPAQSAPTDAATAGSTTATQPPAIVAAARIIHAAYQAPVQQVNLPQVAFEVVRQFEAGSSRFQIRLDPAELGRIDVRLEVDKAGTISARMTVERPETLDLLQRDQRSLQQALQQAGLDTSKTNLEFSLRQNPFAQQGGMGDGRGGQSGFNGRGDNFGGGDDMTAEAATTTYRGTASASGVNLFV